MGVGGRCRDLRVGGSVGVGIAGDEVGHLKAESQDGGPGGRLGLTLSLAVS